MEVYRLAKSRWGNTIELMMSGEGARLEGGRWNEVDTRMIYAAGTRSLAALEVVVNAGRDVPLDAYYLATIFVPDQHVLQAAPADLPDGWDVIDIDTPASSQWGELWIKEQLSLAVQVPSVIVPEESNILINPLHPEYATIKVLELQPYALSERVNAKKEQ